jgi:hypothetical protein
MDKFFVSNSDNRTVVNGVTGVPIGRATTPEWAQAVATAMNCMEQIVADVQTFEAAVKR